MLEQLAPENRARVRVDVSLTAEADTEVATLIAVWAMRRLTQLARWVICRPASRRFGLSGRPLAFQESLDEPADHNGHREPMVRAPAPELLQLVLGQPNR